MNIEAIREARKEAERQIQAALSSFHAATNLHIIRVNVESHEEHPLRLERPVVVSQSVTVTLEQI